jgi:hypothetical protein
VLRHQSRIRQGQRRGRGEVSQPDRCAECARAEIFVHTARLERAHDREVIEALKAKLAEAEWALRQQQKGKK